MKNTIKLNNLVLILGGPGAGKSTLSKLIGTRLNFASISMGDFIRENFSQDIQIDKESIEYDDLVFNKLFSFLEDNKIKDLVFVCNPHPVNCLNRLEKILKNSQSSLIVHVDAETEECKRRITKRARNFDQRPSLKLKNYNMNIYPFVERFAKSHEVVYIKNNSGLSEVYRNLYHKIKEWQVLNHYLTYQYFSNEEKLKILENVSLNNKNIKNIKREELELNKDMVPYGSQEFEKLHYIINKSLTDDPFTTNQNLINNNLSPLIFYAFKKHFVVSGKSQMGDLVNIIDMSINYLYRIRFTQNDKFIIAKGSHNDIIKKEGLITKKPVTLYSKKYLNKLEYDNFIFLKSVGFAKWVPEEMFLTTAGDIVRDYVVGDTGHELLLKQNSQLTVKQINNLKSFWSDYIELRKIHLINLDIHPGNFIWNNNSWILIDTGEVPSIVHKYYEYSDFLKYFEEVWVLRLIKMMDEPIRSVELI